MIEVVLDDITPDEEKANHDQDDKKRGKRDEPGARVFSKPRRFLGTLCTTAIYPTPPADSRRVSLFQEII